MIERQIQRLCSIGISKLYVAVDGPRTGCDVDRDRCAEVRRLVDQAGFVFPVLTRYRATNLGCGQAVSQAIEWFFENEEEGIILEDDCLADPSFFEFAEKLLSKFADDDEIFMISGNNFNPQPSIALNSYGFSQYPHIWGWATWRRAWRHYDFEIKSWPGLRDSILSTKFPNHPRARRYWKRNFDGVHGMTIDTWDYQWVLTIWERGGLVIIPPSNLVVNLGFGSDATHPAPEPKWWSKTLNAPVEMPLCDPKNRVPDQSHEAFEDRVVFDTSRPLLSRLANKIGLRG